MIDPQIKNDPWLVSIAGMFMADLYDQFLRSQWHYVAIKWIPPRDSKGNVIFKKSAWPFSEEIVEATAVPCYKESTLERALQEHFMDVQRAVGHTVGSSGATAASITLATVGIAHKLRWSAPLIQILCNRGITDSCLKTIASLFAFDLGKKVLTNIPYFERFRQLAVKEITNSSSRLLGNELVQDKNSGELYLAYLTNCALNDGLFEEGEHANLNSNQRGLLQFAVKEPHDVYAFSRSLYTKKNGDTYNYDRDTNTDSVTAGEKDWPRPTTGQFFQLMLEIIFHINLDQVYKDLLDSKSKRWFQIGLFKDRNVNFLEKHLKFAYENGGSHPFYLPNMEKKQHIKLSYSLYPNKYLPPKTYISGSNLKVQDLRLMLGQISKREMPSISKDFDNDMSHGLSMAYIYFLFLKYQRCIKRKRENLKTSPAESLDVSLFQSILNNPLERGGSDLLESQRNWEFFYSVAYFMETSWRNYTADRAGTLRKRASHLGAAARDDLVPYVRAQAEHVKDLCLVGLSGASATLGTVVSGSVATFGGSGTAIMAGQAISLTTSAAGVVGSVAATTASVVGGVVTTAASVVGGVATTVAGASVAVPAAVVVGAGMLYVYGPSMLEAARSIVDGVSNRDFKPNLLQAVTSSAPLEQPKKKTSWFGSMTSAVSSAASSVASRWKGKSAEVPSQSAITSSSSSQATELLNPESIQIHEGNIFAYVLKTMIHPKKNFINEDYYVSYVRDKERLGRSTILKEILREIVTHVRDSSKPREVSYEEAQKGRQRAVADIEDSYATQLDMLIQGYRDQIQEITEGFERGIIKEKDFRAEKLKLFENLTREEQKLETEFKPKLEEGVKGLSTKEEDPFSKNSIKIIFVKMKQPSVASRVLNRRASYYNFVITCYYNKFVNIGSQSGFQVSLYSPDVGEYTFDLPSEEVIWLFSLLNGKIFGRADNKDGVTDISQKWTTTTKRADIPYPKTPEESDDDMALLVKVFKKYKAGGVFGDGKFIIYDMISFLFRHILYYRASMTKDLSDTNSENDYFSCINYTIRSFYLNDLVDSFDNIHLNLRSIASGGRATEDVEQAQSILSGIENVLRGESALFSEFDSSGREEDAI